MKILILTPISPVHAGDVYAKLADYFNKENREINFICYPFFAEMEAMKTDKDYLPIFFAMLKAAEQSSMKEKLYKTDRTVVIGNTYNTDKFDVIISFNDLEEEVFDKYIEFLSTDEEVKEIRHLLRLEDLYKPEDAELDLPTIDHLILFLESTYFTKTTPHKAV